MSTFIRPFLAAAACAAASGCTVGPDYVRPAVGLTAAYAGSGMMRDGPADWWTAFGDARLDALVRLALAQNMDVAAASARVVARRSVGGAAAARVAAGAATASSGSVVPAPVASSSVVRTSRLFHRPILPDAALETY